MSPRIDQFIAPADEAALSGVSHVLFVLPANRPSALPFTEVLDARLKRGRQEYAELGKTPLTADLPNGTAASWVVLDGKHEPFQRQTLLRKAIQPLLDEKPQSLAICVYGDDAAKTAAARDAVYVTLVNAVELPSRKAKQETRPLETVQLYGWESADGFASVVAKVHGNTLTRELTMLPPNELTPSLYRKRIEKLAREHGWQHEEFDMERLSEMGAGAFVAVAQGSQPQDAAIVHLTYSPERARRHIALIGKGICFDTGGHNLKPARWMQGMHEDMNGSAVALGILLAATESRLPIKIDCWLAIAQNHISPAAYKQNDIVTALNGMTIEVVHTDAEGRMVLADTLTLASRGRPELMLDFATLTGTMGVALGERYSGILGNRPELLCKAIGAGRAAGERVAAFPFDEDYDEELESKVADIMQCTLEGGADHILATRFLSKFIEGDVPWVHMDLSASNHKGGLGAVASDVTGFGVGFSLELLRMLGES
ncbi:MAG TPA: leucyl aminopeptidase family protein [Methylophilaceae bacterium]|nr:leucyl aminopeptidase family protein [Methylophilaceae bacterium]